MLKIDQVKKNYGDFQLDCTLEVKPGYVTGLVGPNGAGKSTIFKSVLGLINVDEGSIYFQGKNVRELDSRDRQQLGVALAGTGFSEYLMIRDIIPILSHMYDTFDKKFFEEQVARFKLPLDKKIKEFSTGMKAKLKIIIAISHQAKLLILDEPTSGLDIVARNGLIAMLQEYMEADEERAILISSHISSDIESLCDDFYMINNGHMMMHEDTDVLLSDYAVLKVSREQYETLDKQYILRISDEGFGYTCLTNQRRYYLENYPQVVNEKGSIDELITMMIRGHKR